MNRQEYMQRLEAALRFLPPDTQRAALEFYCEMIDDRMEDGMDEVSAVAAMDAPEDIAARLRAEAPQEAADADAQPGANSAPVPPMTDDALEFSSLVERVMRDAGRIAKSAQRMAEEEAPRIVDSAMETAQRAMDEAERAWEQADQAWNEQDQAAGDSGARVIFGSKPSKDFQRQEFSFSVERLRAVRLLAQEMPIRITACEGDTGRLIYYTAPFAPYTATLENGVLTLQNPEKSAGRGGFNWSMLGGLFRITWSQEAPTLQLSLPADALVDLTARTTNGSIKCEGLRALCDVSLETTNSRIVLEQAACKRLELKSSNGRLMLKNVRCKQALQGTTSNSRIEAVAVQGDDAVILRTSNSRIQAERLAARQKIELRTSNGSLSVSDTLAPEVILKTSNGTISGVLPGRQADWAIDSGTSNGHSSLPKSQPGGRLLSAHTSNGSIRLSFQEDALDRA